MIYLEDRIEYVDKLIKRQKRLLKTLSELKNDFEYLMSRKEAIEDSYVCEMLENVYNQAMMNISAIYGCLPNIAYYASSVQRCYNNPVEKAMSDRLVSVLVNGNDVYIKIPLLRKKYARVDGVFSNEMRTALENCDILPRYKRSVIRIVNVYNTGFKDQYIPDNDNIDIKKAVDIIADYITGSDKALNTTLILQSIYTDEIEQSTYIHVSEHKDSGIDTQCYTVDLKGKDIYFTQLQKGDDYYEKRFI